MFIDGCTYSLQYCTARVLENEKLQSKQNGLIDYGVQNNLLEMRSAGWEHFVVSPRKAGACPGYFKTVFLDGQTSALLPSGTIC